MKLIAQHEYIKLERQVTGLEQNQIEHNRIIYLYEDRVVTAYREFPINIVTDISYKAIANDGGLLYLHTMRGVFMYQVKQSPERFIEAYKAFFK